MSCIMYRYTYNEAAGTTNVVLSNIYPHPVRTPYLTVLSNDPLLQVNFPTQLACAYSTRFQFAISHR
jgi:hypothetical protein